MRARFNIGVTLGHLDDVRREEEDMRMVVERERYRRKRVSYTNIDG